MSIINNPTEGALRALREVRPDDSDRGALWLLRNAILQLEDRIRALEERQRPERHNPPTQGGLPYHLGG